jgi:hypothetical protein
MADYVSLLKQDLIEQFKDQPVIDALMEAVGEQLNDVYKFLADLRDLRGIQTAVGKQLDGVGDIVVLSRKEAGELACFSESAFVLDDEEYRKYLIYKVWKNTCDCTYADILKSFRMFWDKPLYYREDPDEPATMIFETGELAPEDDASKILNAPFIKGAGVGIRIYAYTVSPEMVAFVTTGSGMGRGYQTTTLPEIGIGVDMESTIEPVPAAQNITQTVLPEMEV